MHERIWYELFDIKFGEIYLSKYLGLQSLLKRIIKIATIVLSISGIFSWEYFQDYVLVILFIISFLQFVTLIENDLFRSDKEIQQISELKILYSKYFNKLDKIWMNYQYNYIDEKEAMKQYFKIRNKDWIKIEELDSKLSVKHYKKMVDKTDKEAKQYVNKHYIKS